MTVRDICWSPALPPVGGDEFEQRDARRVYGTGIRGGRQVQAGSHALDYRWGGDLRYDDINEVGLFGTAARVRNDVVRDDQVEELSLAAWGEIEFALTKRLRSVLGARADYYDWQVDAVPAANSGSGDDSLLSPKAALAWRIADGVESYLNWGRGFHSNDVRGATITIDPASGEAVEQVDVLVRSDGG